MKPRRREIPGLYDADSFFIKIERLLMMLLVSYSGPGSCCWAAFIKMGALRENSPNGFVCCNMSMNSQAIFMYNKQCLI